MDSLLLLLSCLTLVLAGLALLVWVRARAVWMWKAAILAAEYSQIGFVATALLMVVTLVAFPATEQWSLLGLWAIQTACLVSFLRPWAVGSGLLRGMETRMAAALGREPLAPLPGLLWRVPRAKGTETAQLPRTLVYAQKGAQALSLDLYLPPSCETAVPLVVLVHGGGWDGGDRTELASFSAWLAAQGYLVACPDYRLAPEAPWPAAAEDVRAAIAYLSRCAVEFGGDASRLVLIGRSAGGQIAQAVAYRQPPAGLRALISLYAPADLEFAWLNSRATDVLRPLDLLSRYLGGTYAEVAPRYRDASPFLEVGPGAVPTLLVHGRIDALVWHRQSQRLAERLQAQGVPVFFLDLPWATHAFEYSLNGPGGRLLRAAVVRFLQHEVGR